MKKNIHQILATIVADNRQYIGNDQTAAEYLLNEVENNQSTPEDIIANAIAPSYRPLGDGYELLLAVAGDRYLLIHYNGNQYSIVADLEDEGTDIDAAESQARWLIGELAQPRDLAQIAAAIAEESRDKAGLSSVAELLLEALASDPSLFFAGEPEKWQLEEMRVKIEDVYDFSFVCCRTGRVIDADDAARVDLPEGTPAYCSVSSLAPSYRVEDTETGNGIMYEGDSATEAVKAALEAMDGEDGLGSVDVYKDGERVYCDKTDPRSRLYALMSINDVVGDNLAAARKAAGLSQQDLADKVGLRRATITDLEAGKHGCSVSTLYTIALALDCPIEQFFE